ncbi:hypothetical protein LTR09_003206 [Extremus antarcticus]|uniref:Cytochrome b-c1 complex subunit 10 n=1 Tax=Extremus antarcticus TaxID=702011 RepID=A0AAJ0GEI1_9PEZI|nr:hypothetical protein LTR09_003206 [Extremus antarcticus]
MLPTLARRAQYGLQSEGARGVQPWRQRAEYETFQSKYGPKYKVQPHFHGINPVNGSRMIMAGMFGVAAGVGVLLFLDGVPRVQRDILQKVPIIGPYFVHEVPPEDNPF